MLEPQERRPPRSEEYQDGRLRKDSWPVIESIFVAGESSAAEEGIEDSKLFGDADADELLAVLSEYTAVGESRVGPGHRIGLDDLRARIFLVADR